jgi:hypothetical protein
LFVVVDMVLIVLAEPESGSQFFFFLLQFLSALSRCTHCFFFSILSLSQLPYGRHCCYFLLFSYVLLTSPNVDLVLFSFGLLMFFPSLSRSTQFAICFFFSHCNFFFFLSLQFFFLLPFLPAVARSTKSAFFPPSQVS